MHGEPQAHAIDLGHTARHAPELCLLVDLVAVGGVDALKLGAVLHVGIHQVHHELGLAVHYRGGVPGCCRERISMTFHTNPFVLVL